MPIKRIALALALGFGLGAAPAATLAEEINLPDLSPSSNLLSPEEERELGEAFMRQLRHQLEIIDDPEVDDYIWNLGYRLVANSDFKARPFHFFVVNDRAINAFAGPAGYIGVNAGLILASRDESELSAVIAHEIAHVGQNHLQRAYQASEGMTLPMLAALVAAAILGSQNANITEAAIAATLAGNIQRQINFTRANEREADHIGMQILAQARLDPHAMPRFFARLQQKDRLYDNKAPEFLRTHPVTTSRISESESRAAQYHYKPLPDNEQFYLIKEKLRVLTSDNSKALLEKYRTELKQGSYTHAFAHHYGYALALLASREPAQARREIRSLIERYGQRIAYTLVLAESELALGNTESGLAIYAQALHLAPQNLALSQGYARALLQNGQAEQARNILLPLLHKRHSPSLLRLLAQAERNSGHPGAAHKYLAEYYYRYGHLRTALEHLQQALDQKDIVPSEAKSIQARIQQIKQLIQHGEN